MGTYVVPGIAFTEIASLKALAEDCAADGGTNSSTLRHP
jgi:hypothetical protein